jgi:hypothetical protein
MTIHITNGDATRIGLEQSGVPGTFHTWSDILHDGPTPAALSPEEWRRTRVAHLVARGFGEVQGIAEQYAREDAALERWRDHEEMVFWFEHDLYDQLILLHHLEWLSRIRDRGKTRFSLVCTDTYLGPLEPERFPPLFERRQPISDVQVRLGASAWQAFCAPDPHALEQITAGGTSSLPFLAGALRRHFEDYPSAANGLSRSEAQILTAIDRGVSTLPEIFAACARMEERVFMGDATFWTIVRGLASAATSLISVNDVPWHDRLPAAPATLTRTGRDVLAGRADHIALNGIDRWMGGVHLTASHHWRWDGATLVNDE